MDIDILRNVRIFSGGADLTSRTNKIELSGEYEKKDATNFGSVDANNNVWKELVAGLGSAQLDGAGQWEAGDTGKVDDALWAQLGGLDAWTIAPGAAVSAPAYLMRGMEGSYKLLGGTGDVAPWSTSVESAWPLARGQIAHGPGTARTATGSGTVVDLGAAVPAGKGLYAALHVLSVAGTSTPTITVSVQSAPTVGFGAPTTRLSFTPATARGGELLRVAGPITDQYVRASWTISGTAPSFLFVVSVGTANI